jgi:hypothetical protein|tara:strand:+ start:207 stop:335 length:129 start_codon:yes stop_codon:yes gene_type:complete
MQRQMWLLIDPFDDEVAVWLKDPATVSTHLIRRNTTGPAVTL